MADETKTKPGLTPETAEGYLTVIGKLRDETAAWAAFRSKRFTVSFAVILCVLVVGMMLLSKSALVSIPFFAIAGWVAVNYVKTQAQVDIAQQKAAATLGLQNGQTLQDLEN